MADPSSFTFPATSIAVALGDMGALIGVMLSGASGMGKSSLAARLIHDCPWQRTRLIADDITCLQGDGTALRATAPAQTRGLLELRGFGLVRLEVAENVSIALLIEADLARPTRLPDPNAQKQIGPYSLPIRSMNLHHADAVAKIRLWLAHLKLPVES